VKSPESHADPSFICTYSLKFGHPKYNESIKFVRSKEVNELGGVIVTELGADEIIKLVV